MSRHILVPCQPSVKQSTQDYVCGAQALMCRAGSKEAAYPYITNAIHEAYTPNPIHNSLNFVDTNTLSCRAPSPESWGFTPWP